MAHLPQDVLDRLDELSKEFVDGDLFNMNCMKGPMDSAVYMKRIRQFDDAIDRPSKGPTFQKAQKLYLRQQMTQFLTDVYPVDGKAIQLRNESIQEAKFQILLTERLKQCSCIHRPGVLLVKHSNGITYVVKSSDMVSDWSEPETRGSDDDLEGWERNEVLHQMRMQGISKVRGWIFTADQLSDDDRAFAFKNVCERFGLCRKCGATSHEPPCGDRPGWPNL